MKTFNNITPNGVKKFALATALAGFGLAAVPAHAEDEGLPGEFSANVTLASEYIFRGVSLTDEDPAIQGAIDWSHDSGVYLGAWASNIELDSGTIEIDYYGGYAGDLGDSGFSYDVGFVYYTYPGDENDGDYFEVAAKLGRDFGIVSTTVGAAYVPTGQDAYGDEDAIYVWGDTEVPIPNTPVTAGFHLGYEDFGSGVNKLDWSAGLYATVEGLDLGIAYVDTDVDGDNSDARVLFTIGKSF